MNGIVIAHLYPQRMNIYGDTGNVIALRQRLEWRGIDARVDRVEVGDPYDLRQADLVMAGGGEDRAQAEVAADLQTRSDAVRDAVAEGVVFLTVCGAYQLFGRRFVAADGSELPGIGVFAAETLAGRDRMIGNVVVTSPWGDLVGFENHGGRTFLDPEQAPLGAVRKGSGNNGETAEEGAVVGNCFGTYLHGSLLPKNPAFTDELLLRAMRRRHGEDITLRPLDDDLEHRAAAVASRRPR